MNETSPPFIVEPGTGFAKRLPKRYAVIVLSIDSGATCSLTDDLEEGLQTARRIQAMRGHEGQALYESVMIRDRHTHRTILDLDCWGPMPGIIDRALAENGDVLALHAQIRAVKLIRETVGLGLVDAKKAVSLAETEGFGGDVVLAVAYISANQLAIHIKGDRHAWCLNKARDGAQKLRVTYPNLNAAFPSKIA